MINNWEKEVMSWALDGKDFKGACKCDPGVMCSHRANYCKRFFRGVLRYELFEHDDAFLQSCLPANNLDIFQENRSDDFLKGYDAAVSRIKKLVQEV